MMHEKCKSFFFHDWRNWDINVHDDGGFGRDEKSHEGKCAYDPTDLLPVDPFEMNLDSTLLEIDLGTKISETIAEWIETNNDDYLMDGDAIVAVLSYYWKKALLSSFETQLNPGSYVVDFCNKSFSGLVLDVTGGESFGVVEEAPVTTSDAFHSDKDGSFIHEGLFLSLGYLGVQDLLSVERVCRSLHFAVQNDTLLWRHIHIDSPLSEKITDDALYQLTERAQGSLQCLSLMRSSMITDAGLRRVLSGNLRLKKLSIHGCLRLSVEGLINSLKPLKLSGMPGLKTIKLGRLFIASPEQFDELRFLVGADELCRAKARKLKFYHNSVSSLACDDEEGCPIDIEICPICQKCRLVFDCSLESCRSKGPEHCRACDTCIPRCLQCGRCIGNCEYVETFCLEFVCSACWKNTSPSEYIFEK
ncbi:F-box protein SKIP14-like [Phalaenopsis equestris]|uniref:F-box protein SKIP14-like n=1 Tax=Phalaenopsis equestris TaxID=78828 RepID=UPI0009E2CBBB|nr:F-box protein SKIP14-like [Phalaenopsis equestris]